VIFLSVSVDRWGGRYSLRYCATEVLDSDSVKVLVDILGDRVDLGLQLILDFEQLVLVLLSNEIDGEAEVAETTRATDSMQVGLRVFGEIKVDNYIHRHDIDTTGEQVSAHKAASLADLEIVINPITVALLHLGMNVEAGIPQLRDLLGQQLYSLGRITENDGLSDVQLREQSIEAVQLFSLLEVGIVLGNTFKGEFLH
jgi:hypothetical protein